MITYILKTILCSGLFLLIYYLLLEREKMYRFNRFYLLFGIIFSFIIPLITFKVRAIKISISDPVILTSESIQSAITQQSNTIVDQSSYYQNILFSVYILVTAFLFCRFIRNIYSIFIKIMDNSIVDYFDAKLVLTNYKHVPYSFLKYIFINNDDFQKEIVEKEVLHHELTHVIQKHSIDISFIELIMIFAWFNPFLFFYRKSIRLNHEFLADESVINKFKDTIAYQLLLVNKAGESRDLLLSNPFNYILTKKRLIMMTKRTTLKTLILKQIALIPLVVIAVFIFSTRIIAQDTNAVKQGQKIETHLQGVSQKVMNEYDSIIKKNITSNELKWQDLNKNLTTAERSRLETIFKQMSKEQQSWQNVVFVKHSFPSSKAIPSKEQFESFKESRFYGVWIDENRVKNSDLNNYTNTSFAHYMISELLEGAVDYGKYTYQVNLMTQEYYNQMISDVSYGMVIRKLQLQTLAW